MMKTLKLCALVALAALLAGCPTMPRAPANMLEDIEATEVAAQQVSESITTLTCTKFEAQRCIEPGKAFDPDAGTRYQGRAQELRAALRTAKSLKSGEVAKCLGAERTQAACLATAKLILTELEQIVIQSQGGKP